ncbi:MAG: HD domain-containing protein [SAR324 cluster bacterium]|nr:HD domain-containing protein [SAR324 cluster bacterium]
MQERLSQLLKFLQAAESLKTTLRSAHTSSGRPESVAEHTWRLCLLVMALAPEFPEVDAHRLMKICLIHDLGEALQGDIPAPLQDPNVDKSKSEREDLLELLSPLPELQRSEILELWEEYEQAATLEAKLAKAFDKLETLLQHTQGQNPPDFDYAFNLDYGRKYTELNAQTRQLRAWIDEETRRLDTEPR